jgi:hypothetical protein
MTTAEDYRAHAARCRSLTRWISDDDACENLRRLARECDDAAQRLELDCDAELEKSPALG